MDTSLLVKLRNKEGTARRLYVEVIEFATRLENNWGQYFKPYTGQQLYFEYTFRPILDFEKNTYHAFVEVDPLNPGQIQEVPIKSKKDIGNFDVFDSSERLALRARDVTRLREVPADPIRMINFITEYVQDYCRTRIPAFAKEGKGIAGLIEDYLNPEALDTYQSLRLTRPLDRELELKLKLEADEFVSDIWLTLEPLMSKIQEFMGENPWVVYSASVSMWDLVIDGYVDYRIYVYHEREQLEAALLEQAEEEKQIIAGEK